MWSASPERTKQSVPSPPMHSYRISRQRPIEFVAIPRLQCNATTQSNHPASICSSGTCHSAWIPIHALHLFLTLHRNQDTLGRCDTTAGHALSERCGLTAQDSGSPACQAVIQINGRFGPLRFLVLILVHHFIRWLGGLTGFRLRSRVRSVEESSGQTQKKNEPVHWES
jgi:hypothetical protein